MRRIFTTKLKIILVIAVLLTAILSVVAGVTNQTVPEVMLQAILAPLRRAASGLTQTVERYYDYMFRYEALEAENELLKAQIANMEDVARQADTVTRENDRLRELLNLKSSHESYNTVDAYIIAWSSSDYSNTFTINRGTNSGIAVNMCAITANGEVVGLVTQVGPNYSVVKTILDSTLEISAMISTTGYNGMVSGGYISGNETLLRMDYLPSSAIIRNKDQVVTTGSTMYPRGLIVGNVVDAGFEQTGVAKYAVLDPAADISSMEQVFILTEYDSGGGSATTETTVPETTAETQGEG